MITYTIWLSRERHLGAVPIGSVVRAGPASLTRRDDGTLECKRRMDMRQRANSSLPSREVKESYEKLGGQGWKQEARNSNVLSRHLLRNVEVNTEKNQMISLITSGESFDSPCTYITLIKKSN